MDINQPPIQFGGARPIGRSRPSERTATAGKVNSAVVDVVPHVLADEQRLTMAEVERLVKERVSQATELVMQRAEVAAKIARSAADDAAEKAYREGFADGAKSVESSHEQWQKRLESGLHSSLEQLTVRLAELEPLAVEMARVTLDQILGSKEGRVELLQQVVRQQLRVLGASTVLRVRLSERDTREQPQLLTDLQARFGDRTEFLPDAQMASGGCRIDLKLGQVDASLETLRESIHNYYAKLLDADANL